ncbi:MAG: YraN family protein [Ruminococcaceae bacterium]|nr:YraN family protein [Oscillospiraceae bacterium]
MSLSIKLLGKKGEDAAAKYLEGLGYRIHKRNFRVSTKEIDIICYDGEYIVFVEVKTVKENSDGEFARRPSSYVDGNKKNNLIVAASWYMKKYSPPLIPRIDVVEVYIGKESTQIEHIRSAVNRNDLKQHRRKL